MNADATAFEVSGGIVKILPQSGGGFVTVLDIGDGEQVPIRSEENWADGLPQGTVTTVYGVVRAKMHRSILKRVELEFGEWQ